MKFLDSFFFKKIETEYYDCVRIGFASLLLVYLSVWYVDLNMWFGPQGILPYPSSRLIVGDADWTLFSLFPDSTQFTYLLFGALVVFSLGLLLGFQARLCAIGVFVLLVSFQNRNNLINDGSDAVFRLFSFLICFFPVGKYSLSGKKTSKLSHVWLLRLFQIQVCLIWLTTAFWKHSGEDWVDGTAMYFISRLDSFYGRFPVPDFLVTYLPLIQIQTWAALALETLVPIFIWVPRLRKICAWTAIGFHLATDYMMNLFLFPWIMILGWLCFFTFSEHKSHLEKIRLLFSRLKRQLFATS